MIPIKVQGTEYKSIAQAWRHESPPTLKLITVRLRLRNGWHPDDAFTEEMVAPYNRRGFKDLRLDN